MPRVALVVDGRGRTVTPVAAAGSAVNANVDGSRRWVAENS